MENNDKKFYLKVQGKEVEVSEAVYREYKRPDRAERKRKQRMWRCLVPREKAKKSFLKRCTKKCSECPYGVQAKNSVVSLDALKESGYEEVDVTQDPEANYIAAEERSELYAAIKMLTQRQRELVRLIYVEEKTQKEAASILGINQSTVSLTLQKAHDTIKKFLEK